MTGGNIFIITPHLCKCANDKTLTPQEWLLLLLWKRTNAGAQFWCNVETLQMPEHISRGRISAPAG